MVKHETGTWVKVTENHCEHRMCEVILAANINYVTSKLFSLAHVHDRNLHKLIKYKFIGLEHFI
jgi:hypothetical protein